MHYNWLMNNSFKNPFEIDEEDTIITLDTPPIAQSINNQQIGFNSSIETNLKNPPQINSTNPSGASNESMFDLLDANINRENALNE